jgi:hypothetical protein
MQNVGPTPYKSCHKSQSHTAQLIPTLEKMAGLLASFKSKLEESEAGPSTSAAPKKKIPKVAVYVSGATVCPLMCMANGSSP